MRWLPLLTAVALVGLALACGEKAPAPTAQTSAPPATLREHALGSASAPLTITEYADFQCPFCGRFALTTKQDLIREYVNTGQVRLVFRQFPFLGEESWLAAQASECAADQGQFWEYHDLLFQKWQGENVGTYSPENLKSYAQELGLDSQEFAACLDSEQYRAAVEASRVMGITQGVRATPTFFIDGQKLEGNVPLDVFRQIIQAASGG